jgi:hypothetical protein
VQDAELDRFVEGSLWLTVPHAFAATYGGAAAPAPPPPVPRLRRARLRRRRALHARQGRPRRHCRHPGRRRIQSHGRRGRRVHGRRGVTTSVVYGSGSELRDGSQLT